MEALKPCPLCSGKGQRDGRDSGPTNAYRKWVECLQCGCSTKIILTEFCDDDGADRAWNARPLEDALQAKVDALLKLLEAERGIERNLKARDLAKMCMQPTFDENLFLRKYSEQKNQAIAKCRALGLEV